MLAGRADIKIFVCLYVIANIPVVKAVYQNLVHHCPLRPIRRRESWDNYKVIFRPHLRTDSHAVIATVKHPCRHFKMVMVRLCPKLYLDAIIIKFSPAFPLLHRNLLVAPAQPHRIHIIPRRAEGKLNLFIRLWLRRIPVIFRTVCKQSMLAKQWAHLHHILLSLI